MQHLQERWRMELNALEEVASSIDVQLISSMLGAVRVQLWGNHHPETLAETALKHETFTMVFHFNLRQEILEFERVEYSAYVCTARHKV